MNKHNISQHNDEYIAHKSKVQREERNILRKTSVHDSETERAKMESVMNCIILHIKGPCDYSILFTQEVDYTNPLC